MRKSFWLLLLFIFLPNFFSPAHAANKIEWQDWSRGIFETAKKEHKLILIYGKVSWCHWCQKMDSSTFPDPAVIQLVNSHYVPVLVDIEQDMAVRERYHISEIPSLIVIDRHNREVRRFYGYASANTVVRELSRLNPAD
jgi:thioredoxin-related protein